MRILLAHDRLGAQGGAATILRHRARELNIRGHTLGLWSTARKSALALTRGFHRVIVASGHRCDELRRNGLDPARVAAEQAGKVAA